MKVITVVGARPQFVKAAPVSRVLRAEHEEVMVHTGQHYDQSLSASFFRDLQMPLPEVNLGVGSGTHGVMTGEMMKRLEPVLLEHQPDGVLVYGDTNSTLAAAVIAAKVAYPDGRRPWLAHVEAGLRSFNRLMPEERNRIVADHLADLLLVPTEAAMTHLAREGLADRAELVGDVMVDVHAWALHRVGDFMPDVARNHDRYVLLTIHRAENVDDPARLATILEGLAIDMPIIFPLHPRTRHSLARNGLRLPPNVVSAEPAGYLDMVALEARAEAIATDSGGVQKEAYLSGVPCVTLRSETEWTETVEAGWNRVVDADPTALASALRDEAFMNRDKPRPPLFGDGRAAGRIVAALERHQQRVGAAQPVRTPQEATAS